MKKLITLLLVLTGCVMSASATEITIYFVNGANWADVRAHYFVNSNPSQTTTWPGVSMTKTSRTYYGVECVYSLTINTEVLGWTPDKVIFSNGGASETDKQDIVDGKTYTYFVNADLYFPNNLNGYSETDGNYMSKGIYDGIQDVYQFTLSNSTLGNNDFGFRLKFSDYTGQIKPNNNNDDFTYSFGNGQWETHMSGHSGYFGNMGQFKISHSTEKASEYRITVYAQKGTAYYVKVELISKPVTIAAEKATFSCDRALDFSGTGINAYLITGASGGKLTPSDALSKVPANTGLYLEGSNGTVNVPVIETSAASGVDVSGNMLVAGNGGTVAETAGGYANYILTNQTVNNGSVPLKFYRANGQTVPAGKAYLRMPSAGARESYWFDDETTGIEAVDANPETVKEGAREYYNLNGQRVMNPTKGLYIVNGKKVIIK